MVRPWREKGPGRPWAAQCPPPPLSGAWCGRLRLECLGRAEAAARNMAATPSPNLFDATLQLETLTRLSMTHYWLASLSVTLGKGRVPSKIIIISEGECQELYYGICPLS